MAGADAVRTTAIARREVRASIERMEYHLGRGPRGVRGVQREVNFLNALHRKAGELGGKAVGLSTSVVPIRSFGDEVLAALGGADSRSIGRVKSSILADFSADGLTQARKRGTVGDLEWVWVANSSACPTCLAKHGYQHKGEFVPTHPSCLCIPEEPSDEIRPLKADEIVNMQRKYGDRRYKGLIDDLESGKKTLSEISGVENVNASARGRQAVETHKAEGVVTQRSLSTGDDVVGGLGPRPEIQNFGRFQDYDDYLKQYAAETDDDIRRQMLDDWRAQESAYYEASSVWQKAKDVQDVLDNFGPGTPQSIPSRTHLKGMTDDFDPGGKKVGKQSALKKREVSSYTGEEYVEVLDLSEAGLNARLKKVVKQFSDDMGLDLDDDVRWTLDWDEWWKGPGINHPGADAFVEKGVVYLNPNVTRQLAKLDPQEFASDLRVLAHEMSHQASSMGRKGIVNNGLRPIMEEAGAEINSMYWSRYRWADDLLDSIGARALPTTTGETISLKGARAMYWRHNYADDIEELVLSAVRRNGWNRQAILDDILYNYKHADDFDDFFRVPGPKGRRETIRITKGKWREGRRYQDDVAEARWRRLWDEAPDDVKNGPFSVIDESAEAWPHFFDEAGRSVDDVVGEQKRVANLLNWLLEGDDAARAAAKAGDDLIDDVVRVVDDVADDVAKLVDERPPPLKIASNHTPKGSATKAQHKVVFEAEQYVADAIGVQHRPLFEKAGERVREVYITATKSDRGPGRYGEWWESSGRAVRGKVVDRRLTLEVKRADAAAHNQWVNDFNDYYERIRSPRIEVRSPDYVPATRTSPPKGTIDFIDNPEYVRDQTERLAAVEKWKRANPKPQTVYAAEAEELAQTYFHELTHVLDYGTGKATSTKRGVNTILQQKADLDHIPRLCNDIFTGTADFAADPSFWYAAEGYSKGKVAETVAEITRMYFFGDRTGRTYMKSNPLGRSAQEWREAYPQLAKWVEDNILSMSPDDLSTANMFTGGH